jgi:hypothetical protein
MWWINTSRSAARLGVAVVVTALLAGAAQAVTLTYPNATYYVHSSQCPAGDGSNTLNPDPVHDANLTFLQLSVSADLQNELGTDGEGNPLGDWDYTNWSYNFTGSTLAGTISIDVYKSRFVANHNSGCEILVRYEKGEGDPDDLRWLQMVDSNDPLNGATPPYIDPYPNDDPEADPNTNTGGNPFYYHSGETTTPATDYGTFDLYNSSNTFGSYDLLFYDFPKRYHPPISNVWWRGELWLTSVNTETDTITFHDGILYGFDAGCVPSPSSVAMVIVGLMGVILRRRKLC